MQAIETIRCEHAGTTLAGFCVRPAGPGPHPVVLIYHSALGIRHMTQDKALQLAALGYLAVAVDMYGADADISTPMAAGASYAALLADPERLRARTVAWFDRAAALPGADGGRIAAIGYCFGGRCVLELARSGADAKAVVSYHGILTTHAPAAPGVVKGVAAAYCGRHDPFAPPADIEALRAEMIAAGARFQIIEFSDAAHGFTDIDAAALGQAGIAYDAIADRVSWAGTMALLDTVLAH